MNNMIKAGLLTAGLGLALQASETNAAVTTHTTFSNAVNYCQAFTPGPSNSIRNRVIGLENIGPTIAVACNFEIELNGAASNSNLQGFAVFFTNNTTAPTTVTCTLLTGTSAGISGGGSQYAVTRTTAPILPGAGSSVTFSQADNPTAGATDLGNLLVGVNCNLPTNVTMSAVRTTWTADNGI